MHGLQPRESDCQSFVVAKSGLSPYHNDGRRVVPSQGRTSDVAGVVLAALGCEGTLAILPSGWNGDAFLDRIFVLSIR
jgi:hypothetical protein